MNGLLATTCYGRGGGGEGDGDVFVVVVIPIKGPHFRAATTLAGLSPPSAIKYRAWCRVVSQFTYFNCQFLLHSQFSFLHTDTHAHTQNQSINKTL